MSRIPMFIALLLVLLNVRAAAKSESPQCADGRNGPDFTVLEILTEKSACLPERVATDSFPLANTLYGTIRRTQEVLKINELIITLVITDKPVLKHEIRAMKDSAASQIFHIYLVADYLIRGERILVPEIERQMCLIYTGDISNRTRPTFGGNSPKVNHCLLILAHSNGETERERWIRWLLSYAN